MGCSGSKGKGVREPVPAQASSQYQSRSKSKSNDGNEGVGAHKTISPGASPYQEKMVVEQEEVGDDKGRPEFVVPIPLPNPFHPRILTEISLPRHVPRPYPQLGNYDPTAAAKRSKSRSVVWVFGGPGCGKYPQSARLAADLGLTFLSLGSLLRSEARKGTAAGLECDRAMKEGQLVATDLVMSVLEAALFATSSRNFVVEGFPRKIEQAKAFDELLGKANLAIYLECSSKELEKRVSKRPKISDRCDETDEIISKRLETFQQETLPLLSFYGETAPSLLKKISAERSEDKIYTDTLQAVMDVFFPMTAKTTFVLILGGPGCGKGTQCGRLVEDFGFHHLSTGELLREEVKQGSDVGKRCEKLMKDGKLVPLAIISQLLQRAIIVAQRKSFLIDGIKTVEQANEFDAKVGKPTLVLYLSCPPEVMEERLLKRAQTSGRSDDNPKTIKKRIDGFSADSKLLVDYYKKTTPDVYFEVAVDGLEGDIYTEIKSIVEKKTKKSTKADKMM